MQETKNRTPRRCVLSQQAAVRSPTWAVPSSCSWYTNWRVPKSRINYMNAIPGLWPNPPHFTHKNVLFQFPSAVQRRTGSTWASCIKTKRARIDLILSDRWITVLILLDLFRHTFTIETLALRRQGGKTNNSNVQKRHRAYVTRFKCLANMLVGGWISMRSFHTRDPKTINSLLHQCFTHFFPPKSHSVVGLRLMTAIIYLTVEVVFIFKVMAFLFPSTYLLTGFSSWNKLLGSESQWISVLPPEKNPTWTIILLNYVCNSINVIAMTCLVSSSVTEIKFRLFPETEA